MILRSVELTPHPKAWAILAAARLRKLRISARRHNVAMLHLGRCGSTVLADMLRQHEGIHWDGETLQRYAAYEVNRALGPALPALRTRMNLAGAQDFGFETKVLWEYHLATAGLPLDEYIDYLRRIGFDRFIVLRRRNYVKWAASETIAARTNRWHERGSTIRRNPAVLLDVSNFRIGATVQPLREWFAEFDRTYAELYSMLDTSETLHLTYEDDIEPDPLHAYRRACDFLEYEPQPVSVRLRRTNPFPLDELVTNLDEVRHHLEPTPYTAFVPSDGHGPPRPAGEADAPS